MKQDHHSGWMLAALLLAVGATAGCEEDGGGRDGMQDAEGPGGGKADDTAVGPAAIVVDFAATGGISGVEVSWRAGDGEVRPIQLGKVENVQLSGGDCIEVRQKSRSSISGGSDQPDIVTTACADTLGLQANALNELLLPVFNVHFSELIETDLAPHIQAMSLGVGSNDAAAAGELEWHYVEPDISYVVAPGVYSIKLGDDGSVFDDFRVPEDDWALYELDLGLATYLEQDIPVDDWRLRVLLDLPEPPADTKHAFTGFSCSVEHAVHISQGSNRDRATFGDETTELYVWPVSNAQIGARISGIPVDLDLTLGSDTELEAYNHTVPKGEPLFEGGAPLGGKYSVTRVDGGEDGQTRQTASCHDESNALQNAQRTRFQLGTYIVLPPGRYEQTAYYDGLDPVTSQFEIRSEYE